MKYFLASFTFLSLSLFSEQSISDKIKDILFLELTHIRTLSYEHEEYDIGFSEGYAHALFDVLKLMEFDPSYK